MGLYLKNEDNKGCLLGIWEITEDLDTLIELSPLVSLRGRETFNRFKSGRRKKEWLCTRILIDELLGYTPKLDYEETGRPYFVYNSINISISHSGKFVCVLINKTYKTGVDIERIQPRIQRIAHKFLAEQEAGEMDMNNLQQMYLVWSAKEALYKLYSRKHLSFRENIQINPVQAISESGMFTGTICLNEKTREYELNYKLIEDFIMVWVCE